MKKLKIDELNQYYNDAETVDKELFSDQRSNILLIAGVHYSRKDSKHWSRIRDARDLNEEQKLRITKNHIQKIFKAYVNSINSYAPGVTIVPKNDKEIQDRKTAELNLAVWKDAKEKYKLRKKFLELLEDFCGIGECAVKIFWNPNKGEFMGYEQKINPTTGHPEFDEMGQPVAGERAVFSGDFEFERIFGFNLLRDSSARSRDEIRWECIRKMVDVKELKALIQDPEHAKRIEESNDETFFVFDGQKNTYTRTKGKTLIREFYFRPCPDYPNGYFYICSKDDILFEGELPFGVYPIITGGFDMIPTSPRAQSIVKQLRPVQIEINRTASKIAETQTSFSDKLLVQAGTKVTNGGQLPGVRYFQYTGMPPTVLEGKAGDQYLGYLNDQIEEMYRVAGIPEINEEKGQSDPFAMLFSSVKQKKAFSLYAERFEEFMVETCKLFLELARNYYDENRLIPAIGRNEYVNISEFKKASKLCYDISVEPMSDDITTMMGRQLVINHALQYVGTQLDKKDIGKLLRSVPFGNFEESFDDLTIDYDSINNMILALDRGEQVEASPYDDENYVIKRLMGRMRMADFKLLPPQIQQNYEMTKNAYEQIGVQKMQQIQRAQSGFIPSNGPRVKVDFYVPSPTNPGKNERATLPSEAVDWLIKKLADQGSSQEQLMQLNEGAVAEMSAMFNQAAAPVQGQAPAGVGILGMQ